jgi:formylglycine-generating enzyme required for sulfatase activity
MWQEAVAFCAALSKLPEEQAAGRRYRLPAEAEWEYACRAGAQSAFHFGNTLSAAQANIDGRYPYRGAPEGPFLAKTAAVGSYPPNRFGLHDMHGNVQEWCADWYDPDYYSRSPEADPKGPPQGVVRTGFEFNSTDPGDTGFYLVARGGSWLDDARGCRSAYRGRGMPHTAYRLIGLRVACDATGTP